MRIVHLADLHLGFRRFGRTTSKGINCREADVFRAFREALTKIKEINPDLLLIAGDVFHWSRPHNMALVQTQRLLQEFISSTDIETIVIAGNHDSVKAKDNTCILELFNWMDRMTVFTQKAEVWIKDNIRIACLPHNALLEANDIDLRPHPDFQFNLLMVHGTVDGNLVNDDGGTDVPADLLQMPWDYVACGHFHTFRHIDRFIYYAGAIERTSNNIWQEAEEEKGFIEFDLEHKKVFFHPVSTRKTIDFPVIDAQNKMIDELNNLIADHVKQVDIRDAVVRQRMINLPRSLQSQLDYKQIRSFQAQALHYEFVPKPPQMGTNWEEITQNRGGSLYEDTRRFLENYPISQDIDRQAFVNKGLEYLQGTTG